MAAKFDLIRKELIELVDFWEEKLVSLPVHISSEKQNSQQRTIKQIVGHMVDSATNNTHRIIHMQYQDSPVRYPDYANLGNNDRWIAIQNYQEEDWNLLVRLWASSNRHIVHVLAQVDISNLGKIWVSATGEVISLEEMITDFPRHFRLHIEEIKILIDQ